MVCTREKNHSIFTLTHCRQTKKSKETATKRQTEKSSGEGNWWLLDELQIKFVGAKQHINFGRHVFTALALTRQVSVCADDWDVRQKSWKIICIDLLWMLKRSIRRLAHIHTHTLCPQHLLINDIFFHAKSMSEVNAWFLVGTFFWLFSHSEDFMCIVDINIRFIVNCMMVEFGCCLAATSTYFVNRTKVIWSMFCLYGRHRPI